MSVILALLGLVINVIVLVQVISRARKRARQNLIDVVSSYRGALV